jgi:hypothetical protein
MQIPFLASEAYYIDTFMNESSRTTILGYLFINFLGAVNVLKVFFQYFSRILEEVNNVDPID